MHVAEVKITDWDNLYYCSYNGVSLKKGDSVILEAESATELGKVIGFRELEEEEREIRRILRKAENKDFEKVPNEKRKKECLAYCKEMIKKHELPMKLVDIHFSYDGSRITFAFIADGRVDFRGLLKDLTAQFNCNIRLNQIGIRDEAKMMGDCGHCGQELCCKKFIKDFKSITSEMAEFQQVSHRGSDRISGICGRLMCCLGFEERNYEELAKNLPEVGTRVSVDGKKGVVVGHHILKQTVDVEFPATNGNGSTTLEVDINRNK